LILIKYIIKDGGHPKLHIVTTFRILIMYIYKLSLDRFEALYYIFTLKKGKLFQQKGY